MRTYTVACLSGDGVGPELMAEATRALHEVSRMHGFRVEDVHVPFGTEALTRSGHPLPLSTRVAYLEAEAILVASAGEPALGGVEAELDLRARATQVAFAGGSLLLVTPLSPQDEEWTVRRAFAMARERRGRLQTIDQDGPWAELVDAVAGDYDGVAVDHLSVAEGLPALAFQPERLDVVVAGTLFADALEEIVSLLDREGRVVARARLAGSGPGLFAPVHSAPAELAGQGMVDPAPALLAVSLLLAEGLGERAAAGTLASALAEARRQGARPLEAIKRGIAATTRELADAVLGLLPVTHRNAEFVREALL
ncbi:MAG: hypothetical protein C4305_02365 [Thermoleophilia bacterium]